MIRKCRLDSRRRLVLRDEHVVKAQNSGEFALSVTEEGAKTLMVSKRYPYPDCLPPNDYLRRSLCHAVQTRPRKH